MHGYEKRQKKINGELMIEVVSEEGAARTQESGMLQPIALEDNRAGKEAELLTYASSNQVPHGNITVIRNGTLFGSYTINGSCVTIGRGQDNDIYLPDEKISRHHARIVRNLGGYYLEDLTSANGTYVNAQRVIGYALQDGDIVSIGKFKLCYGSGDAHGKRKGQTTSYKVTKENPRLAQSQCNQVTDAELVLENKSSSMIQEETQINKSDKKGVLDRSELPFSNKKRDLDEVLETLSDYLDK